MQWPGLPAWTSCLCFSYSALVESTTSSYMQPHTWPCSNNVQRPGHPSWNEVLMLLIKRSDGLQHLSMEPVNLRRCRQVRLLYCKAQRLLQQMLGVSDETNPVTQTLVQMRFTPCSGGKTQRCTMHCWGCRVLPCLTMYCTILGGWGMSRPSSQRALWHLLQHVPSLQCLC